MATQAITSGAENKIGMTVTNGNRASGSATSNTPTLAGLARKAVYDTLPRVASADIQKLVSASNFANNSTSLIMGYSLTVGGIARDALKFSDSNAYARNVNKIEGLTTRLVAGSIRLGRYDIYSGTFSITPSGSTDSFSDDHAASPTMAIPGELTYFYGSPTNADYEARNI